MSLTIIKRGKPYSVSRIVNNKKIRGKKFCSWDLKSVIAKNMVFDRSICHDNDGRSMLAMFLTVLYKVEGLETEILTAAYVMTMMGGQC